MLLAFGSNSIRVVACGCTLLTREKKLRFAVTYETAPAGHGQAARGVQQWPVGCVCVVKRCVAGCTGDRLMAGIRQQAVKTSSGNQGCEILETYNSGQACSQRQSMRAHPGESCHCMPPPAMLRSAFRGVNFFARPPFKITDLGKNNPIRKRFARCHHRSAACCLHAVICKQAPLHIIWQGESWRLNCTKE